MRSRFDEQLALLNRELIEMGALCEEVIALSAQALTEGNAELAARVAPLDQEIDRKERDIESLCLRLLLQQQLEAGALNDAFLLVYFLVSLHGALCQFGVARAQCLYGVLNCRLAQGTHCNQLLVQSRQLLVIFGSHSCPPINRICR